MISRYIATSGEKSYSIAYPARRIKSLASATDGRNTTMILITSRRDGCILGRPDLSNVKSLYILESSKNKAPANSGIPYSSMLYRLFLFCSLICSIISLTFAPKGLQFNGRRQEGNQRYRESRGKKYNHETHLPFCHKYVR